MSNRRIELQEILEVLTYALLFSIVTASFWAIGGRVTSEFDALVLFFIGYTLILVLPIEDFDISPWRFRGRIKKELIKLQSERSSTNVSQEAAREANQEVDDISRNIAEDDLILMRLSVGIEETLQKIAEGVQISGAKMGIGMLTRKLAQREILTDNWLLDALHFFQEHRNELVHKGKTDDIRRAIDVGRTTLAELKEIQQKYKSAE